MRFYPDSIPPYPLEPTPDKFTIKFIDERHGNGVVSLVKREPGEIIFVFTGNLTEEITQYSLQVKPELHIHDPYFMGKILHSCDPNAKCIIEKRMFVAIKKIHVMQVITIDYASTEEILFKNFECHCKSQNCRGYIVGKKRR